MTATAGWITIVSGLPRSGTSLLMQMLAAGGVPVLTDHRRAPDEDNPRGYYEFEPVKRTKTDAAWLKDTVGKAVKLVHALLHDLPADYGYRVLFLRRRLEEVVASQRVMLARQGKPGAPLADEQLIQVFQKQLDQVGAWLAARSNFSVLYVDHGELLRDPHGMAGVIDRFLGGGCDIAAMAAVVDPALYRQRRPDTSSANRVLESGQ